MNTHGNIYNSTMLKSQKNYNVISGLLIKIKLVQTPLVQIIENVVNLFNEAIYKYEYKYNKYC